MARVPFLPLEIPFILGLDDHSEKRCSFPEVSGNAWKFYFGVYGWTYWQSKTDVVSRKKVKMITTLLQMSARQARLAVAELLEKGFILEEGDFYKFPELQEKRKRAYKAKSPQSVPKDATKPPESGGNQSKPNQTKLKETKGASADLDLLPSGYGLALKKLARIARRSALAKILKAHPNGLDSGANGHRENLVSAIKADGLLGASVYGVGSDRREITAFCIDATSKKTPIKWLVAALGDLRLRPTEKALDEAKQIEYGNK